MYFHFNNEFILTLDLTCAVHFCKRTVSGVLLEVVQEPLIPGALSGALSRTAS
jgi:hypothetical protein